jgi:hypothetical protein
MALKVLSQRRGVPCEIELPGPEGDAVRARIGREAYDLNVQQYCCAGLNFGYFYDRSPIILYDGATPPAYTMGDFTPSTVPGCRAPHVVLADGRLLYDALGPGYTLVRTDPAVSIDRLRDAARGARVPLGLVDLDAVAARGYDRALVLVRTDQHVAWRGDALPNDTGSMLEVLRGARVSHGEQQPSRMA